MPANAATPNMLNISDPNTPPKPTSDSTTNDEITFVKNSGAIVEIAMKLAAARSYIDTCIIWSFVVCECKN